jgi:hypothetical protein
MTWGDAATHSGASKVTWKQTKAKEGNGAPCKQYFATGSRTWDHKVVNDGTKAEVWYENPTNGKQSNIDNVNKPFMRYCFRETGSTHRPSYKSGIPFPHICDGDE